MTSTFTSADMILQKKNNKIMSGGYSINSLLMQKNLAPIALQSALQTGGKGTNNKGTNNKGTNNKGTNNKGTNKKGTNNKGTNKLDQLFDNLAVPAGLLFIQPPNKQINTTKNYSTTIGDAIPSKLYDKLLDIVDKKKRLHFGNKTIRAKPGAQAKPGAKNRTRKAKK
jgi:hypothetical protein